MYLIKFINFVEYTRNMREEEILEILNDWNLWRGDLYEGISRDEYLERILKFLESNMIVTIIGIRRVGKSFIIRQVANRLSKRVSKNEILIINFEDRRFPLLDDYGLQQIFEVYLKNLNPRSTPYVFLDEVHKVRNWEKWVRTIHELREAKVIVSGSTSQLIKEDLATLLTGRHLDIEVFPLSFREFLKFKGLELRDKLDIISKRIEIKKLLDEYIEYGGFPEVVLSNNKKEILLTYFEDIITKDIVQRYRVFKINDLLALARFYLTNIASLITFNSIKEFINLSVDTIETFTKYLESVYLIFFIKKFSWSVKQQEKAARKIYSIDTGLSNAIGFRFLENKGKMMENLVAIELLKRAKKDPLQEIYYWRDYQENEVDFVVKEGLKVKTLIQVTYASGKDDIKKRELRSLIKAGNKLNCKDMLVITWDYEDYLEQDENVIRFIPLWKWLLMNV